jgi:hypothetical protein
MEECFYIQVRVKFVGDKLVYMYQLHETDAILVDCSCFSLFVREICVVILSCHSSLYAGACGVLF